LSRTKTPEKYIKSFRLNKSIALGMVKPNLAKVGQKLEIDILGKMHKVSIIEDSPYDPENKLLRA